LHLTAEPPPRKALRVGQTSRREIFPVPVGMLSVSGFAPRS
jgi:hypothetical protein